MSTTKDNVANLSCNGNTCSDAEGNTYTYDAENNVVNVNGADGYTGTLQVSDTQVEGSVPLSNYTSDAGAAGKYVIIPND